MPKQLNIKLGFEADTKQAQQQIAQLQKSLDGLLNSSIKQGSLTGFNSDIVKAQQSILQLKTVLNNSLNADTGRLDLSKFSGQLSNSGLTLNSLSKDMNALGADGQKAFLNLANSIVTAQKPMVESNKLLDGMWTALKNTARWQLSSSILHGFMGALQGAYGYAQDLNKSLTDIAIVTGQSTDQMAAFAEQANRSAQALSVSTTAYTDAALIYYQQGLDDEAVKARTDITMQMSNVTGESAEHVSSYMTAIWNNFAEGSENLEHYADVITALGAATASSSEEIANGMQQFAAVADTVGLSYEYAATALATVVAQTRQSESTVGNSFRTIFSRLQGLKLGETLEDGTDLNKYSKALATVGVNIKDQNGELKDMDTILDEIGAKWQTLAKDQQIALAQTVGGVRQYTNLVALFDNWDTFQKNLNVANTSDGTLQQQADTYAQSWEAAQKRVKAAWQAIYQDLIDDKFFVNVLNGIEKVLQGLNLFIDSIGGLKGALSGIGVIVTTVFQKQIVESLEKAQLQLSKILKPSGSTKTYAEEIKDQMSDQTITALENIKVDSRAGLAQNTIIENLQEQVKLNREIDRIKEGRTAQELEYYEFLVKQTEELAKQEAELIQQKEIAATKVREAQGVFAGKIAEAEVWGGAENEEIVTAQQVVAGNDSAINTMVDDAANIDIKNTNELTEATQNLTKAILEKTKAIGASGEDSQRLAQAMIEEKRIANDLTKITGRRELAEKAAHVAIKENKTQSEAMLTVLDNEDKEINEHNKALQDSTKAMENQNEGLRKERESLIEETAALNSTKLSRRDNQETIEENCKKLIEINEKIDENTDKINQNNSAIDINNQKLMDNATTRGKIQTNPQDDSDPKKNLPFFLQDNFAKGITRAAQGISQVTMGLTSLSNIVKVLSNPDLSGWEKFIQSMSSLLMGLPMMISGIAALADEDADLAIKELVAATNARIMGEATDEASIKSVAAAMKTKEAWFELTLIIMAVVAAIWLVVKAFEAIKASTPEGKLEATNKRLEEATKEAQEATNAYNELKSTLQEYADVKKEINDIEDSTERTEKIIEENEKILELLDNVENWHDLIGDLTYDSNGLIELSDHQQEILQKDSLRVQLLAKQKEIQEQINKITDTANVENPKYQGPKIYAASSEVPSDKERALAGGYGNTEDITLNVARIFANSMIDFNNSTREDWKNALAPVYGEGTILEGILDGLEEIASTSYDRQDFNNYIQDQRSTNSSIAGYEKLANQMAIQAAETITGEGSITALSSHESVQAEIADLINKGKLDAWIETGVSLENALKEFNFDLETKNSEAADAEETERKNLRETRLNSLENLVDFDIFGRKDGEGITSVLRDRLETLSDEDLKIAISLDLDKIKSFQQLKAAIEEVKQQTEEDRKFSIEMQKAEDAGLNMEDWNFYVEYLQSINEKFAQNKDLAAQVATANMRLNQGVESLSKELGNYSEILEEAGKGNLKWSENNIDYAKGLVMVQKALADIANIDLDTIQSFGPEFVTGNLKLIEEAAKGDVDAIDQLIKTIANAQFDSWDWSGFEDQHDKLKAVIDDINFNDIKFGVSFDDESLSSLYSIFDELIQNGVITAENVNAALANIGMTPIVEGTVEAKIEDINWDNAHTNGTLNVNGETVSLTQADVDSFATSGGTISLPIIRMKTGEAKVANKQNLSNALADATFTGGTGRNLAQNNRPKSSSCFVRGTKIILNNSWKNIEDIKVNDIVLSYDEKKKKNVFSKVLQTMVHFVHEKIYSLFIKNDKLEVTGNHKFLVIHNNDQNWTEVSNLQIGDLVLFSDGTWHEISNIDYEIKKEIVYNFEVSNTHNYYVGENGILAHNKGGGGKGSGGKDSAPKKQKREKRVDEKDRYHDIKEEIKDLNTEMDRLEKIRDRVFGKAKLKYMDQEIKKQEKQISLTKEYIKEAKNYLAEDKKRLDEIKMGAKYVKDEATGEWLLTNYEEVLQNIVDAQNKAVDAFNEAKGRYENGEISEEELKAQEEAFNKDKETFEERKKILKQYEDTFNTVQEQVQKLIDDEWKLYDLKLEKVKVEVDLELKVSDQSKKLLEWSFKYLGNDLDAVSDKVANLSSQMNYLAGDLETVQNGISGIFANHGINFDWNKNTSVDKIINDLKSQVGGSVYSELTEAEVDALMEYMNKLMDIHDEAAEGMKETLETFSNAVEKANEKLERQLNRFDGLKSTLTTYQDIVNLTGKNILKITSKNLEDLNKVMIQNDQNKLMSAKAIYETNKGMYEATRAQLNEALEKGSASLVEQLEDQINSLEDTMNDALESYRDALKETLEDVQQAWEDALDAMEDAYEKAFGDLGSTWYQEQFDRQKELNELYLPDYKKYHELNKSMTELQKNLANTNNQIVKGKAKELLDEINDKMKSGTQVSEYEAGIIERRVALLKAEDELLAARNAKSTVRMTRDNEGGFSYTYTADEDQINNAQQGYSDAYYELRDYQVTGANDLQSQWLQIQGEFAQRVREIEEQYKDNETARIAALKQLQAEYQTYVTYFSDQMNAVYKWESVLRDNDLKDLQNVTGLKLDEWNTYITSWNDTLLNTVIPGYDTYDQLLETWDKAMNTAITSVNKAHSNYEKNVKITLDNAGMSVDGFKEQFERDMANVQIDSDNTTGNIRTLTGTTINNFKTALGEVSNFTDNYLDKFDKVRNDNLKTMDNIQDVIERLMGLNDNLDTAKRKADEFKTETAVKITEAAKAIEESFNNIKDAANGAAGGLDNLIGKQNDYNNMPKSTPSSGSGSLSSGGMSMHVLSGPTSGAMYDPSIGWYKIYDTGGYTGDWHSSEGRFAMLHEKELVLNKEDTKNMLDAVNVIRSMQTPINGLARNMFNYNSLNNVGSADTLEQQVHIDATFPNVSDHNEIELALNNLVNSASQYVNRK